ncbi:uncharacterized protein LOC106088817 [Stomoxys calcitrans]|uniref:Odorant binding protein n=1 Tax=Stomoxys calcitrans TaxID=35570 RepID=A0A1I8PGL2_STOCA|nr:uncharacterized protein LOC106088817 [Stomoxys calcitrans]
MRQLVVQFGLTLAIIIGYSQLSVVQGVDMSEAKLKKVTEECMKQTGVSLEQANLIMKDELENVDEKDFSHNMRCYLHCYHLQMNLTEADGTPISSAYVKFMENRFANKKEKVIPALLKCQHVTDPDKCEFLFKFEMCMAHTIEGQGWEVTK